MGVFRSSLYWKLEYESFEPLISFLAFPVQKLLPKTRIWLIIWYGNNLFETACILDLFISDCDCLRPLPLRLHSFETFSFETTVAWDFHLDHNHLSLFYLGPLSVKTTFIWHHIDLRPHLFETTFIWDDIRLWPHPFEITFILHHVKVKLLWFTVNHICII